MDNSGEANNIKEIFADGLSDIPSDEENSDDCEDDYDFQVLQDNAKVMIPLDEEENDDYESSDIENVVPEKKRKVLIPSNSESNVNELSIISLPSGRGLNSDDDDWSTEDVQPKLEDFEGSCGVTVAISEPNSIPEVVKLILGDDLFEMFSHQTSVYYNQNSKKHKIAKTIKWSPVNPTEFKKFLALIILMGRTQKGSWREYWSTDPLLAVPIFPKIMSRNRFEQIWTFWHFNNNEEMTNSSSRLFKIQPVLEYFVHKFNTVYKPKQNLSLDEGMIPWRGRLSFRTYNPGKIVKYGLLVRILSESDTGYICNLEIYTADGKKLEETILSVLEPYLGLWHHVYQDNYYNSISIANKLLEHKTRVCGTIREKRGLPLCLKNEGSLLKSGEIAFRRKGDVLLLIWMNKRQVRMITTIHDSSYCSIGKKSKNTGEEIKKPICVHQYNANMKGVDRADQHLSYNSILRKSVKWTKKAVLYLINCGLFNAYRIYQTLNPDSKIRYKDFLLEVARNWLTLGETEESTVLESSLPGLSNITKRTPSKDYPQRLSGDMKKHVPVQIPPTEKKEFPTKRCKVCSTNGKRSETRYVCKICDVPLHTVDCFTRYHTLKKF
uniref:DDE_Tnp_1_7 domain-containing protein n=1 Tax=Strongyloides papillosus TaxID=174720 RepID=A0A0N5C6W1_STREA